MVFAIILYPFEGRVLSALASIGTEAVAREVHKRLGDPRPSHSRVHATLLRLSGFGLVTRTKILIKGPGGHEPQVIWELSSEGRDFLGL